MDNMANSAGNADKEMRVIQESLDYKLNALKVTGESISKNLFEREDMKSAVDIATDFLGVIDAITGKLGLFGTIGATTGIVAFVKNFEKLNTLATSLGSSKMTSAFTAVKSIQNWTNVQTGLLNPTVVQQYTAALTQMSAQQVKVVLSTTNLTNAQKMQIMTALNLVASENSVSVALAAEAMAQAGLSDQTKAAVLAKAGLTTATATCTAEELKNALATQGIVGVQAEAIMSSMGLSTANNAASFSFSTLATSISAATKALMGFLISNPMGWAIIAGTVLLAGKKAFDLYGESVEEARQKAEDASNTFNETNSSLSEQASRVQELREKLASGTLSEAEAYEAKKELLDIQNQLKESYGEQAAGIDLVNGKLDQQIEKVRTLSKEEANRYLNENRDAIKKAEKELNKIIGGEGGWFSEAGTTLGLFDDNFSKESERIKEIASKYADNIELDELANGQIRVRFVGNAEQAKSVLNDFMTDIRNAQNEIKDTQFMDSIFEGANDVVTEANDILDKYQGIYDTAQEAQIIADESIYGAGGKEASASKWLNDYAASIQKYNDALASGDPSAITKAKNEFQAMDLAVQALLKGNNFSQYSDMFAEARSQLDESSISYEKFRNELNGTNIEEGRKSLKDYVDTLKSVDGGLTDIQFSEKFLEGLGDDEISQSIRAIIDAYADLGLISTEPTQEEIEGLADTLVNAGVLVRESSEEIVSSIDKIAENNKTFTEGISGIQSLIGEQSPGKSISLEDFNAEGMEDYRVALEHVNGAMQLNADKVNEIIEAKAEEEKATIAVAKAQDQSKYLENARQISQLREQLSSATNMTDEQESAIQATIDTLLLENSVLADNCNQYNIMTAAINEATSAYQHWMNAQNASDYGDMANDTVSAMKLIRDTYDSESDIYGNFGSKKFDAAVDFIVPDTVDKDDVNAIESYMNNFQDYLTFDENGNFDGLNIDKFLRSSVEAGLMSETDGVFEILDGVKVEDFVSELNMASGVVQAFFDLLQLKGGEFDWSDETTKTLGDLGVTANEAAESLRNIKGNEDLKIVMDVSQFENAETACATLDATIEEMNGVKAKPGVDASQIENANAVIQYCVAQKQLLEAPAIMSVDTSGVTGEMGTALSLLQQFQTIQNQIEMQASVEADTSVAEAKLAEVTSQIDALPESVKTTLNIDTSSSESIQTFIDGLSGEEIVVKYGVDSSLVDDYTPENEDATVKYNINTEKPDGYQPEDKKATVTYNCYHHDVDIYNPEDLQRTVTYNIVTNGTPPSGGTIGVNGTAHSLGTAYAGGNWGTAPGGKTLVGELG